MTTTKRTFCRVCEPACGMIATVQDEQLIRLEPDREHPVSKGFVCNKGIYGLDIHNDPDRLRVPLRRTAAGDFEEVSWDTALTGIAERARAIIERHGGEAVASYTGNPSGFNSLFGPSFGSFITQLGARRHFSSGTQDCANKFAGSEAVFGTRTLHPVPDLANAEFILILGENPAVSHMTFFSIPNPMGHLKAAVGRGAEVVYINPRRIESARSAGTVTLIRPDTDVYLLAGMLNEIERTHGFDPDAVAVHGRNVDELRAFLAAWPVERAARITGIDAAEIRRLAERFANADGAAVHMATGVNMGRQGTLAYWLVHMLSFVTGNLGRRGGNYFSEGFYARSTRAGTKVPKGMVDGPGGPMRKPGGVGINLPGALIPDYVLDFDPPVRAMFVSSGNPVLSIGGEARLRQAFEALELLVCVDIYRNATAEYADYVLPAAGAFEREDINLTGLGMQYQPSVQFTEAVVPPGWQRKPDWWIYERLSQVMGFDSALDGGDEPDMWARIDAMLASRGASMAQLREAGVLELPGAAPDAFFERYVPTDDHTINCFPEEFGDALQRMQRIAAEFEQRRPDALQLITKRDAYMLNSWYANVARLKHGDRDRNRLFMHPADAERRQIADGDRVRIENANGRIETEVRLSDELLQGVVALTHGWGHANTPGMRIAQASPGVNPNALLPSGPGSFEPLSNQSHMTGIDVEVVPVAPAGH